MRKNILTAIRLHSNGQSCKSSTIVNYYSRVVLTQFYSLYDFSIVIYECRASWDFLITKKLFTVTLILWQILRIIRISIWATDRYVCCLLEEVYGTMHKSTVKCYVVKGPLIGLLYAIVDQYWRHAFEGSVVTELKANIRMVAATAQWFSLRLPSCGFGFESQVQHLRFSIYSWILLRKGRKWTKRGQICPFKKPPIRWIVLSALK